MSEPSPYWIRGVLYRDTPWWCPRNQALIKRLDELKGVETLGSIDYVFDNLFPSPRPPMPDDEGSVIVNVSCSSTFSEAKGGLARTSPHFLSLLFAKGLNPFVCSIEAGKWGDECAYAEDLRCEIAETVEASEAAWATMKNFSVGTDILEQVWRSAFLLEDGYIETGDEHINPGALILDKLREAIVHYGEPVALLSFAYGDYRTWGIPRFLWVPQSWLEGEGVREHLKHNVTVTEGAQVFYQSVHEACFSLLYSALGSGKKTFTFILTGFIEDLLSHEELKDGTRRVVTELFGDKLNGARRAPSSPGGSPTKKARPAGL